jgi:FlaA1/EpsC-like NDP-sugar epimerase
MATTTTKSASQSSDKSETILVTGATGTVGSEVIKQVVKSDTEEPIQIDYYKPETLREALKMLINFSYSHHFSLIW